VIELDFNRLVEKLQNPPKMPRVVIMPDFFVDHFVLAGEFEDFLTGLRQLAEQGGGNLMNTTQLIRRGGNSVNTASALLSLGADPCLIVTTDEQGASMLSGLVSPELDLSHVHTDGRLSATVSIETKYRGRNVNLMVSDSGSAAGFQFSMLNENDLDGMPYATVALWHSYVLIIIDMVLVLLRTCSGWSAMKPAQQHILT